MEAKISFFVEGNPKAQPRPRATVRGKHASIYDCGTANEWKYKVAMKLRETVKKLDIEPTDKPVVLYIDLQIARPKSHYYQSEKRKGDLKPNAPRWHTSKPDVDNFAKAIMDAINDSHLVWKDDSQVCFLQITKEYAPANMVGANIRIDILKEA